MNLYASLSLRQMLTLPYILLVLFLVSTIAVLSFFSGRDAINNLSEQMMSETVSRISQAIAHHVGASKKVLATAFPDGISAPDSVESSLSELRNRFWLATSIQIDSNNYAYYGSVKGEFYGLWRSSETEAQVRLRTRSLGPRTLYSLSGIQGELVDPIIESKIFEPRNRPWFAEAAESEGNTWSSIYVDFKTQGLVTTLARRVDDSAGRFAGVVATDISLETLDHFLKDLSLTENGLAFIVERDGNLIGTSRGANLSTTNPRKRRRLNAANSNDRLTAITYQKVSSLMLDSISSQVVSTAYTNDNDERIQVAISRLTDEAGLDWLIVLAVPQEDFLAGLVQTYHKTLIMGFMAAIIALVIGWSVLTALSKELHNLTIAAKGIGDGDINIRLNTNRDDALGELVKSLSVMQHKLLTDRLTGLFNRETIMRRIEDRIAYQRRANDSTPFGVLFVDLNQFKQINDQYGHDVGDQVLCELSNRLLKCVRASDLVGRYAGDEFIILLESVQERSAVESARRNLEDMLQQQIEFLPAFARGLNLEGASVGIAMYPNDGLDVDSLIKHADKDMYKRKPVS